MRIAQLAKLLIDATTDGDRRKLLLDNEQLANLRLANEIVDICHSTWTNDPVTAQRAAAAMRVIAGTVPDDEIKAARAWVDGISYITKGKFEQAVGALDKAAGMLVRIGRHCDAARTQMAQLLALGMLGRYDDAVNAGEMALRVFIEHGDETAAGKIEVNLSNIVTRAGSHRRAEKYCKSARRRFKRLGLKDLQAVAENGLANTYSELNEFEKADRYYRMALETALSAGMHVTEAEIEASIGSLAQIRGQYAEALSYLERSRSKYEALHMPHQSAVADLDIADLYAELNLGSEAAGIYERVTTQFNKLKMRAEAARASLNYGRVAITAGDRTKGEMQLERAFKLYTLEQNDPGLSAVLLAQARSALAQGDHEQALVLLNEAGKIARRSENPRDVPVVNLLMGEAGTQAGNYALAAKHLELAESKARTLRLPDLRQASVNELGKLADLRGDISGAERHFKTAIGLIEELRTPLISEEFTMPFLASRLEPYGRLARLYLRDGRLRLAFEAIEAGRSRSLLDAMDRNAGGREHTKDQSARFDQLRTELNAYYKRLDRASNDEIASIRAEVTSRENALADLTRKMASVSQVRGVAARARPRSVSKLIKDRLGKQKILIEFVELDGTLSAFVVGGSSGIKFVGGLGKMEEVTALLDDLHFQFGALRYGVGTLDRYRDEMRERADRCLEGLYTLLLEPLDKHLRGCEAAVFIPVGALHYVPFHALRDDTGYMVERLEITYAPSATVWSRLQDMPGRSMEIAALFGFADERIPLVETEVGQIKAILPQAKAFTGQNASFSAFERFAPRCDILHLACHGQFRAENPMFSSLHLSDGWVTVRDICSTPLKAELVTLSACDTGLSKIFAGEEILGLARGFLSAGASNMIVSLWSVNDAAAGGLMSELYSNLQRGMTAASSLQEAQISFIRRGEHPYLWSPFILIGR